MLQHRGVVWPGASLVMDVDSVDKWCPGQMGGEQDLQPEPIISYNVGPHFDVCKDQM